MRCFEFCRAQARIFAGFPAAGDHARRRPFGYHRGASLIWNIVALNRFVQCNVHMEDMRIAQRGLPFAVPPMEGEDPVAVMRWNAASRFCRHPLLRSLELPVRSRGCERATGASIFPLIR